MARLFLEETFDTCARYGTAFDEAYAVTNSIDAGGNSYGKVHHPHPMLRYDLNYNNTNSAQTRNDILDLFHRSFGTFGGFRLKHRADFSTNAFVGVPTFADQVLLSATLNPSALRYQLTRWYGTQVPGQSSLRLIRKPVAESVLVGIMDGLGVVHPQTAGWALDNTTGVVEFTNNQRTITAITKGATTIVDVGAGHTYFVGANVHVSGVVGMTEINGRRGAVLDYSASTVTLAIDSSAFTDYASGGQTNRAPQAGESATAGCYFDIPVRFEADITGANFSNWDIIGLAVNVVEILNP